MAPGMGRVSIFLLLLACVVPLAWGMHVPRFPKPQKRQLLSAIEGSKYNYTTKYFTQNIDHFGFEAESYRKFQQRYLINDEWWAGPQAGPIFMYCGNEGPIDWFAVNTGFMWDIAPKFRAMLVFPEHRYYGESLPFGKASYKNVSTRAYLTAEQALADFVLLMTSLQGNLTAHESPVILFGGSYGGMLAAWMRLKYPHIAAGALASSAPILQFEDIVPPDTFNRIVSADFMRESRSCFETIRASWAEIEKKGQTKAGLKHLARTFHLCDTPKEWWEVRDWLEGMYANIAMVDYPIPADFLAPLPAHPIKELCRRVDALPVGSDVLDRVYAGANLFFNYTGTADCFEIDADPHGEDGWNFQACTEMVMPMSSNPNNSMFPPADWDGAGFAQECRDAFGVWPRAHWVPLQFGGKDIRSALRLFGSNIIFSNGQLDPWSGGGVLKDISDSLVALKIPDGAHHLDLRPASPADPPSVRGQRNEEERIIARWIREFHSSRAAAAAGAGGNEYRRRLWWIAGLGLAALVVVLFLVMMAFMGSEGVMRTVTTARHRRRQTLGDLEEEREVYEALPEGGEGETLKP